MSDDEDRERRRLALVRAFSHNVPHNRALGMRIVEQSEHETIIELPYAPHLVGNPDTGTLHGGAITALLDGCSGAAVFAALKELVPICASTTCARPTRAAPCARAPLATR
jgi:uncharacterized protein (TIGR00369 family)